MCQMHRPLSGLRENLIDLATPPAEKWLPLSPWEMEQQFEDGAREEMLLTPPDSPGYGSGYSYVATPESCYDSPEMRYRETGAFGTPVGESGPGTPEMSEGGETPGLTPDCSPGISRSNSATRSQVGSAADSPVDSPRVQEDELEENMEPLDSADQIDEVEALDSPELSEESGVEEDSPEYSEDESDMDLEEPELLEDDQDYQSDSDIEDNTDNIINLSLPSPNMAVLPGTTPDSPSLRVPNPSFAKKDPDSSLRFKVIRTGGSGVRVEVYAGAEVKGDVREGVPLVVREEMWVPGELEELEFRFALGQRDVNVV
ncbi:hypothetical protein BJ508DRAFT_382191 [Ascobolus immersus RN42]|uniref:Uncharacterized protein n=1 Tax=Ascobolus immersus RN42 TaxID=1160509 RepID=A0A3N4HMY9_ASCIM|nr:hypothetical protein BJ508DRAFT_382191 [Ascobolus immersus RN42]